MTRRSGATLVYLVASFAVLMGFCSLAVDLGRAQVAKTELRRVADAAARAAAYQLQIGSNSTTIKNTAANMAAHLNLVDGATVVISTTTDVQIGNWSNGTFTNNGTPNNAVRVYARRITGTGSTPITLLFSAALGKTNVDVWASAIANIKSVSTTVTVQGNSNPWLAGEPTGTLASQPDPAYPSAAHPYKYDIAGPIGSSASTGEPYSSPPQVGLTLIPGATLTVTNVSGAVSVDPTKSQYDADGTLNGVTNTVEDDDSSNGVSEHGISDLNVPIDSLLGVFLTNNVPDSGTVPPVLDFSTSSERDYTSISPLAQQSFLVGDGSTSSGTQQSITVPSNATRLFLGTMDSHEWSNNTGSFTATITETYITTVQ